MVDPGRAMPFPTKPVHENLFQRRANVSLHFIVVGGSIAGLSCAYNLRQAGHHVQVLERSSGTGNAGGGVRVPPNMTKLLLHWGLGDKLTKTGIKCPRIDFLESTNGEWLSSLVFHEEVMKELQADTYGIHYVDLYEMIYEITVASGVQIDFNSEVVDVDVSGPSVLLASGERLSADIIVGADGVQSIVREKLVGWKEEQKAGPYTGYTYTVSAKTMTQDPDLRPLIEDGTWKVWLGARRCILTFLVRPDEYAVQVISPDPNAALGWDKVVPLSVFEKKLPDFEKRCQRLMQLGVQAVETQHIIQEPLEDWFDNDGHVVLIGDAAHVLNPGTTHGSALAMEDGAVLGSLFSRLRTRDSDEIIRLMSAYQEIREGRCAEIAKSEYEKVHFSVLEEGDPVREMRDAGFRAAREQQALDWEGVEVGESYLQGAWEEFKGSFGYEAYDAADDWWIDWGAMRERLAAASSVCEAAVEGGDIFAKNGMDLAHFASVVVTSTSD